MRFKIGVAFNFENVKILPLCADYIVFENKDKIKVLGKSNVHTVDSNFRFLGFTFSLNQKDLIDNSINYKDSVSKSSVTGKQCVLSSKDDLWVVNGFLCDGKYTYSLKRIPVKSITEAKEIRVVEEHKVTEVKRKARITRDMIKDFTIATIKDD